MIVRRRKQYIEVLKVMCPECGACISTPCTELSIHPNHVHLKRWSRYIKAIHNGTKDGMIYSGPSYVTPRNHQKT